MGSKLMALGLMLAGCTPPVYARHQDYGLVPQQHRAQAALSDIELIAREICTEGISVTENDFFCSWNVCTRAVIRDYTATCLPGHWRPQRGDITWNGLRKIIPGRWREGYVHGFRKLEYVTVKLCDVNANCTEIPFKDEKQASDFAAAVNAYLQAR